jgi:hypothetical protein
MSMDWDKVLDEQAKDTTFGAIPASKYPLRVVKAEAVTAGTGNPMINIQTEVMGGPYDTKKVFERIVFSPNPTAMRFTLRKLAALGVTKEILRAQNPSYAQIAVMIVGAEFEGEVTVDKDYNPEEPQNKIKTFRALPGGPSAPSAVAAPAPEPGPGPKGKTAAEPAIPKPDVTASVAGNDGNDEEPF